MPSGFDGEDERLPPSLNGFRKIWVESSLSILSRFASVARTAPAAVCAFATTDLQSIECQPKSAIAAFFLLLKCEVERFIGVPPKLVVTTFHFGSLSMGLEVTLIPFLAILAVRWRRGSVRAASNGCIHCE